VLRRARHSASPAELKARLAAERRGNPFLIFRDGEGAQRIVELTAPSPPLRVGRDDGSDIVLDWDPEVSRVHAWVERVGRHWTMVDDGCSRNGSFVNGERVRGRRRLKDGDVLRVGATALLFSAPPRQESSQTAPAARPGAPAVSPAQRRVLIALCRPFAHGGFAATPSNRQIAAELVISIDTVKTHLGALFEAFELRDVPPREKRATLVRLALERNAIPTHELDQPR
jgi:pSer/pThr/pTyr-binding forkhead associated (FHA) protein